ncbi:MAG TPA: DeoR/GlpR family DNA-binding transcription regulator [Microvirga sp.]|jgi:DeoR family ulaG and ulaABCDEF operon transcriptional repressor|nr:DeoR/GlpR family DNA-binding transcription regulator [Microvirga sp.]
MLERERHGLILKLVNERSIVSIGELVSLLDASEATIRRDINALADQGEVKRIRGGAEAINPRHLSHLAAVPFAVSQGVAMPEKRAIGRAAAALIGANDSIIINGGTTTWHLVEFLKQAEIDVLTNSFPIAAELVAHSRCRIVLPGGTVYRDQGIILSPFEADTIDHFAASTLFTGAYAVGALGMMETDPLVVNAERRLLTRAERLVVMVDSRKLRARCSMVVVPLAEIDVLITDDNANDDELQPFRDAGVEVIIAEIRPEDRVLDAAA